MGSDIGVGVEESENVHVLVVMPEALEGSTESDVAENFLGFLCAKLGLQPVHVALFPVCVELVIIFELGHGGTPVEVLLVEVGRDLNPGVQFLLSLVMNMVEDQFTCLEKDWLPFLVEMGLLELVEEVLLDHANWSVMGLPVVFIVLLVAIPMRRAIVRVLGVLMDFVVSDPPELSAVIELLIIWLMFVMHGVSEDLVPYAMVLIVTLGI